MRFEDITEQAGVTTKRWATGATMVDINNDGYLDIYVSVSGPAWSKAEDRANLLFVNNRNHTFTEAAAQYGIADTGFTTHAVFLDYNRDGCLDLFLLNNSPKDFTRGVQRPTLRACAERRPAVTTSSIGMTVSAGNRGSSRTCPGKPAYCATPAMDSASPSPT